MIIVNVRNLKFCPYAKLQLQEVSDWKFTPLGQARVQKDWLRNTHPPVSDIRSFVFHFTSVFTSSVHQFFFRMGGQSRCSGCKELKPAHDFGRPGKYCTSPAHSDNERVALAEV